MVNVKKLTHLSLFLCISLILHYVESLLPPIIPVPGVKVGLANVITLILCILYGKKEAFSVLMARVLIASLFFGSVIQFLYSAFGGVCAFLVIALFFKKGGGIWYISALSAFIHNAAQLAVAVMLTKTPFLWWYIFPLTFFGVISGIFIGVVADIVSKNKYFKNHP